MLSREAASWLARLQSGREPDIQRKFLRWRNSDPRHAATFDRIRRTYEQAGLLRHSRIMETEKHQLAAGNKQWRARPALAAAAALVLVVATGVFLLPQERAPFAATEAVMLTTRVGEIRHVDLADGSTVTLDTNTSVVVQIDRSSRRAQVKYGRARFHVAEGTQPFVVQFDGVTFGTRQGVVDVEQHAPQERLEVLAGTADVRRTESGRSGGASSAHVSLGQGQSLTVGSGGAERIGITPRSADWTLGMLQFDGTPLAEAVALANRYSKRHIIVAGDVGRLRLTGAFRAGDTVGLSKAIAAAFQLSLLQAPDGNIVLSPGAPPTSQKNKGG